MIKVWSSTIYQTFQPCFLIQLLQPDGTTVPIRAMEPLNLIQMPFNLGALTDEERRLLEMKRHRTEKLTVSRTTKFTKILGSKLLEIVLLFLFYNLFTLTFWIREQ